MSVRRLIIATLAAMLGVASSMHARGAATREPGGAAQASAVRRSVWDGVYTDVQAKRGKEAYDYSCASCHAPDLEGDPGRDVPALYGEDFIGEWNKHTVKDLVDLARKAMPKDSPGSLRAETYVDIVTYLLQANEFPSGEQELSADPTALERVGIDKVPASKK